MDVEMETICYDSANLGTEDNFSILDQVVKRKCAGKDIAILINNAAEFQLKRLVESLGHVSLQMLMLIHMLQWSDAFVQVCSQDKSKVFDQP
jgi:hypothetical protein